MKAVAYYRMSSDKQDTSISQQSEQVPAAFPQFQIAKIFKDEGKSGSKDTAKRKGFLAMVEAVSNPKSEFHGLPILCLDLSRFGRLDTIDGAEFKSKLRDHGVKLFTKLEGMVDWNTMTGRILDCVQSEANASFSRMLGQKSLKGRIQKTEQGFCNGQPTPYGCKKLITQPNGNTLVLSRGEQFSKPKDWTAEFVPGDATEVEAVHFLFKMADGEDLSYREMGKRMRKFPSPEGDGWSTYGIKWVLQNPIYCGVARFGTKASGKFFRVNGNQTDEVQSKTLLVKDGHKRMIGFIDHALFNRVQERLSKKGARTNNQPKGEGFALSGILTCGNCGNRMSGQMCNGGVIYRCHSRYGNADCTCGSWIVHEASFLPYVLSEFTRHCQDYLSKKGNVQAPTNKDGEKAKREAEALRKKIKQGQERFLTAPSEICKGLADTLASWQGELKSLEVEAVKPSPDEVDWFFKRQQEQVNALVLDGVYEKVDLGDGFIVNQKMKIGRAELRRRLKELGCKISVWFEPTGKKGGRGGRKWQIVKTRMQGLSKLFF